MLREVGWLRGAFAFDLPLVASPKLYAKPYTIVSFLFRSFLRLAHSPVILFSMTKSPFLFFSAEIRLGRLFSLLFQLLPDINRETFQNNLEVLRVSTLLGVPVDTLWRTFVGIRTRQRNAAQRRRNRGPLTPSQQAAIAAFKNQETV